MHRRPVWLIVPILVLLVIWTGCANRKTVTTRIIDDPFASLREAKSWVGHTRAELIDVWGDPTRTATDGQGGEILTYTRDSRISVTSGSIDEGFAKPSPIPGQPPDLTHDVHDPPGKSYPTKVRQLGKFWIDPEGTVYRFEMDPKLIEKGEHDPPVKSTADAESW